MKPMPAKSIDCRFATVWPAKLIRMVQLMLQILIRQLLLLIITYLSFNP